MLRTLTAAAFLPVVICSLALAAPVLASPGPPPPDYIVEAAKHLVPTQTAATFDGYADELAGDVTVWVDGEKIASNKADWLVMERRRVGKVDRRVLGYAVGYNTILVFDQFDDRSALPDNPDMVFDSRFLTRAVQYRFGPDHMIHAIHVTQTEGVLQKPF
ncbi:hypothetical protein [Sphingomonas sp. BAUL-RG-20F-R05-02]|uniref:hypothetical protein n=1 Tax=Sphingomonas sp. BAUL-RG-20F-R05-02 TaxID=2914830 RepID=UPI001F5A3641|nr:hypothetical protein [Sphingomonas sp. BAUL-RG-20F-R05-02]